MNRYAYVGYDPVNFVDPSGLALRDVWNDIAHYAGQAWGIVFVGPTNALFTGLFPQSYESKRI
jgi:hypothetical protein